MKILLDLPNPDSPTFEVDHQIMVALATLHEALIRIRGAGRFGSRNATIMLDRDTDADIAVAALSHVGIRAAVAADGARVRQPDAVKVRHP